MFYILKKTMQYQDHPELPYDTNWTWCYLKGHSLGTVPISPVESGLFQLFPFTRINFGKLYFPKNFSTSSKFSNLFA